MAKEAMKFGEAFSVTKISGTTPTEPKTRHYVIGWTAILAIIMGAGFGTLSFCSKHETSAPMIHEAPALSEGFSTERTRP